MGGRDTYLSPLAFDEDGRIKNITTVKLDWPQVTGAQYSLDIVTKTGEKIAPCVGADIIGQQQNTVYEGYCPSARDRLVDKSDIAQFRLCRAFNGNWANATCVSKAYDGIDDALSFTPPSALLGPQDEPRGVAVDEPVNPLRYSGSELESFFDSETVFNGLKKPLQSKSTVAES